MEPSVCADLREFFINLLHYELIHLSGLSRAFVLPRVVFLSQNPLQRRLQVRETVLMLQVVGGAHDGMHE